MATTDWEYNEEIKIFREYLRIPSVHPNVDYTPCVEFLKKQAKNLQLSVQVCHPGGPTKPVIIMTWLGEQPELPSIMLNSHMDVVPVYPDKWIYPPFAAEIDKEGRIYGRGAQDMKSVAMQYLAAIRALRKKDVILKRTIHVTFIPDEEISGEYGMKCFIKSDNFKMLNVGFCLDEGCPYDSEIFPIFYAEKTIWNVEFIINGTSGHGSLLLNPPMFIWVWPDPFDL